MVYHYLKIVWNNICSQKSLLWSYFLVFSCVTDGSTLGCILSLSLDVLKLLLSCGTSMSSIAAYNISRNRKFSACKPTNVHDIGFFIIFENFAGKQMVNCD